MSAATTLESTPTDTQNPEQGSDDAGATLNEGGSTEPTIADVIGIVTEIKGLVQSHGEILTKMHGSDESAALRAQLDALTSENAGLKAQVEALSASCKSLEANGKKLLDNLRKQGLLKQ